MEKEGKRDRARAALYTVAGLYLVYLAYKMTDSITQSSGNERILMIVFTVLFAVAGLGIILSGILKAYRIYRKNKEEITEDKEE